MPHFRYSQLKHKVVLIKDELLLLIDLNNLMRCPDLHKAVHVHTFLYVMYKTVKQCLVKCGTVQQLDKHLAKI